MRWSRVIALMAVLAVGAAACADGQAEDGDLGQGSATTTTQPGTTSTKGSETTPSTTVELGEQSALALFAGARRGEAYPDSLPSPTIDTNELLQGQIPDGIPAIDAPEFVGVGDADEYLEDEEAVVVLDIDSDVRAYPVQILIYHEIVNDVVGGVSVAITYCPLCNSAVTYERTVQGGETTFGTSGLLFNSALVMYDRATESLWTHYNGEAIAGIATGEKLQPISSPLLGWAEFKSAFPDGRVLDRDRTGHIRSYGVNPYTNYDDPDAFPFLFRGSVDDRIGAQRRVTGVAIEGAAKAWAVEAISEGEAKATHGTVGEVPVVIFWRSGQATALESSSIAGGRDVGSVGVFLPQADGQTLSFREEGEVFVDDETGSVWNVAGEAIDGPLAGAKLEAVNHLDTFWFAWSSYNPGTELIEQ